MTAECGCERSRRQRVARPERRAAIVHPVSLGRNAQEPERVPALQSGAHKPGRSIRDRRRPSGNADGIGSLKLQRNHANHREADAEGHEDNCAIDHGPSQGPIARSGSHGVRTPGGHIVIRGDGRGALPQAGCESAYRAPISLRHGSPPVGIGTSAGNPAPLNRDGRQILQTEGRYLTAGS
jgi:hypothetical protein